MFDADLHGPHTYGNVMVPVVGEAPSATVPFACAVSWGLRRDGGQRDGERRRRRREEEKWGEGSFYTSSPCAFLKCDRSLAPSLAMSMSHVTHVDDPI